MSLTALFGFALQFLVELMKLNDQGILTRAQAQAATDAAIAALKPVGPPS